MVLEFTWHKEDIPTIKETGTWENAVLFSH